MGFMKTPKVRPDPAIEEQKRAEMARLAKEEQMAEAQRLETERKMRANLIGTRSLQSADIEGYGGFRRQMMGKTDA